MTSPKIISTNLVALLVLAIIGTISLEAVAVGQCCLGAQNSVTESHDGRFRVEATSLTGTGPRCHGPYKFRFRTLKIGEDGRPDEIGRFEREWDTTAHFNMTVCVSPTGNGFALSSSLEAPVIFFAPDGTILAAIDGHAQQSISWGREGHAPVEYELYGRTRLGSRSTTLWLPLFHITGPETQWVSQEQPEQVVTGEKGFKAVDPAELRWLQRMLAWRPETGARQAERVEAMFAKSDEAGLIDLGLSALRLVESSLEQQEQEALRRVQQEIIRRLCGHRDAWKNLDLLAALCHHPNEELRSCAKEQLSLLLPGGEPNAEWIRKNRHHLSWDSKRNVYIK